MNWLQTGIIVIISFLLARIIIDAGIHRGIIHRFLSRGETSFSTFITAVLFVSWFLSLFFSNTVVVLSMLPIARALLEEIPHAEDRRRVSTHIALALIYGANTGGMGSLTGSPLNLVYLGFLEISGVPGRENITFFSWMLLGIPASLLLLLLCRIILKWGEPRLSIPAAGGKKESDPSPRSTSKYLLFFLLNLILLLGFTAAQLIAKPSPLTGNLNIIDIALIIYLLIFIFFSFIFPRGRRSSRQFIHNAAHMAAFIMLSPVILILETFRAAMRRFYRPALRMARQWDDLLNAVFIRAWKFLLAESPGCLKKRNPGSFVSLNRMIYDLPFYGLLFMTVVLGAAYLLMQLGDNPATPIADGYIPRFLENLSATITPGADQIFLFLLVIALISTFITEFVSNTVVALAMFPLALGISQSAGINPLYVLLTVTIGASSAFMTPIATTVNAITYAGLEGVSLRKMLKMGFFLNILAAMLITGVIFLMLTFL